MSSPLGTQHQRSDNDLQPAEHQRTILLVDDEENILASLRRLLRREGYNILTANSGEQGLALLAQNGVDVIISDQRMPCMTGVEFLRQVKTTHPDTVRMVLSGYTELQSITDAINEGAIYKFLTKPWEDDQLRANVKEAFRHKELADENKQLSKQLSIANTELARTNQQLRELLEEKQQQLQRDRVALDAVQEILQGMPWPIVGLDDDGMVVCANREADALFAEGGSMIGSYADECLPETLQAVANSPSVIKQYWLSLNNQQWQAVCRNIGGNPGGIRGRLLTLMPHNEAPSA